MQADLPVRVVIGGADYQNWFDVDMDSDVMTPADAFSFSATIPKKTQSNEVRAGARPTAFDDFREGAKCDIYVGNARQMAGVIDRVTFTGNRSESRMRVSGRDLAAYLVDCEAKSIKVKSHTVKTLMEKLIDSSFGIKSIIFSNEENRRLVKGKKDKPQSGGGGFIFTNPTRATTKIDPGQRISSILDTHTKRLGVTWWMTADGSLFIGKPNYNQPTSYSFIVADDDPNANNVESYSVEYAIDGRFSELQVNGQGNASKGVLFSTTSSSGKPRYKGVSRDPDLVERGIIRKTIIADGDVTSKREAQHRADIEQGQRRLSALVIKLTVADFGQPRGQGTFALYAIDTLASVRIDEAGIDGTYYVTQRRFREDRGRRRTELTLHEKGVWLP
jgi:prophage tail gpP-like protein